MPNALVTGGQEQATAIVRRWSPIGAILALQLIFFPVPIGIWTKGAIVGGLTALVALGMALTYRSNGVVSFAQGDLGLALVVLVHLLIVSWGWSWFVAVPAGLLTAAVLGIVVEVAVIRRFRRFPRLLLMVATIGLPSSWPASPSPCRASSTRRCWRRRSCRPFTFTFTIGDVIFSESELLALIAVPIAAVALYVMLQHSQVGPGRSGRPPTAPTGRR